MNEEAEKKDEGPVTKKSNKNTQLAIILFFLAIIIIAVLVSIFFMNSSQKFVYNKLDFTKTKTGDIVFYTASVPLTNSEGQVYGEYQLRLREDPRKQEPIPVNISDGQILFNRKNVTYISLKGDGPICENNVISVVSLTDFLYNFGGIDIKGALDNESLALTENLTFASCVNNPNNTVISVSPGNVTEITKINNNCYVLKYKDCEINNVTERFVTAILKNYMDFFDRKN